MRLPTLVVASFRRSCLSDINKVRNFLAEYGHMDFGAEVRLSKDLEKLRTCYLSTFQGFRESIFKNYFERLRVINCKSFRYINDSLIIKGLSISVRKDALFPL
jgi:hypothetical protein